MGKRINRCKDPEALKDFSQKLSGFAKAVKSIVEDDHLGSLVYAGGDDVLAFVPLASALECAEELQKKFSDEIEDGATLSVGLGIGHVMEAMGELLELGREAEKLAKGAGLDKKRRKALGIILDKRSGGRRSWRKQWIEEPLELVSKAQDVMKDQLGAKKVFEIEDILRRLPETQEVDEPKAWQDVLKNEVERALGRAGGEEAGLTAGKVGLSLNDAQDYAETRKLVEDWINRYIIARELHRSQGRDDCQKGGEADE
jgi:CRISPR-associated protein Cmr2